MITLKKPLIAGACVFVLSAFLLYLSIGHAASEAYLFPLIVSTALFLLSGFLLARELSGFYTSDIESVGLLKLLPALGLFIAYLYGIEWLGMYSSSMLALFLIAFIYHPPAALSERIKSSAWVAVLFTGAMYILFSVLLKVRTPTGLLI